MCGIVGYIGYRQAQPVLLNCLSKLEYRGYDSCGIAVNNGHLRGFKDAVRVEALKAELPSLEGSLGIGHTRWATHGKPTAINAHPHFDCTGKVAVVHNGIISNFEELRLHLLKEGHTFVSDTDTEVIPHLIEKYYQGDPIGAFQTALTRLEGSFAIAVLFEKYDKLLVSRRESPLVVGIGDNETVIASDVPALLEYVDNVIYLEDGDTAVISKDGVLIEQNGAAADRTVHHVNWDRSKVEKNGYDHFLIKEIHEQPDVIKDSLSGFFGSQEEEKDSLIDSNLSGLTMLGCGTSYNACLVGKYIFEELLGIPVRVESASEFMQRGRIISSPVVIGLTQSGETADVLLSLKRLKKPQVKILVITNVPGSTASRIADQVIYTAAGPEMSVAASKSYMAQLIELFKMAFTSKLLDTATRERLLKEFRSLNVIVQRVLETEREIAECANILARSSTAFYVGRGINYPTALEGALKLKEISYIHAEGYAAGELKHGPLALLDEKTPVVALVTPEEVYGSMVSTVKEIKARGSPVIALADERDESIASIADFVIKLPHTSGIFAPVVNVVALQLLAYYAAKFRGCPIDFPRNLAKSVTVV